MSYNSIPQMILSQAAEYPYRPAFWLRGSAPGAQLTFRDLAARLLNAAVGLKELGVQPGTRVGIYAANSPEWCIAYLAVLAVGGVIVPLDRQLKYLELRSIISHAQVEHLFCTRESLGDLRDLAALTPPHPQLVALDADHDDLLNLARLERIGEGNSFEPHVPQEREPAVLLFTSGTSGNSKGVMLSQRNILANLESVKPRLPVFKEDRFLSVLPAHHTFEATAGFLYPLSCGASIVHAAALNSTAIASDIKEFKITLMCGVPLLLEKMYLRMKKRLAEAPAASRAYVAFCRRLGRLTQPLGLDLGGKLLRPLRRRAGLDSLRVLVSGGAALGPEINRFFNELGITLVQGYGLTETSPVISVSPLAANVFASVGPPLPGIEAKIVRPNNEGIGEIVVRGGNVMLGYYENEAATRETIQSGWLQTGDLGYLDR
ncbi:MAG: AMP-binding protein, partial [bacterium]